MHHAYPRECPYPHISGTTVNMRTEDWDQQNGQDWDQQNGQSNRASKDEIMRIIGESRSAKPAAADAVHEDGDLEMLPWLHEEELLVNRAPHSRSLSTVLRNVVAFVAVGSLSVAAVQN